MINFWLGVATTLAVQFIACGLIIYSAVRERKNNENNIDKGNE